MPDAVLTLEGLIVPKQILKRKFASRYSALLEKLIIQHKVKVGPPKRAILYEEKTYNRISCIVLPRGLVKALSRVLNIEIKLPSEQKISANLQIDLFHNQTLIVERLEKIFSPANIAAGTATAILNLRAGMGKTFVAAGLIARLKFRTLYIVPKRPLMFQAIKDLKLCLGNCKIGGGNEKKQCASEQDITVLVINTALGLDKDFFRGYSLVIYDEVHSYCSDQRKKIFRLAHSRVVLGMSATTEDRADGFDMIAHKELAPDGVLRAESIPGFGYADAKFSAVAEMIYYNGPDSHTEALSHPSTGLLFTPYMISQYLDDPYRGKLVIEEINRLYNWRGPNGETHSIYVFCEERAPLKKIYRGLMEARIQTEVPELDEDEKTSPRDIGEFIGGISDEQVQNFKSNARVLLTTYGYSGTGVSIDKMTAIVFLTPRRANMKQILARILRRGGDLSITRRIIDIVDNKTPLRAQSIERARAYEFYNMQITRRKVSFREYE